jgi:GT2 family glycosyltransferase
MKLRYIGDRSIVINDSGTQRRLHQGDEFDTHNTHLVKFGYFVDVNSGQHTLSNQPKKQRNSIQTNVVKNHKPFIGYTKLERSSKAKISICIVSKDGNGVIQRCIESIFEHVKYKDFEVLICDTGTTDARVLQYYKEIKNKYNVIIHRDHVYNFSINNNYLAQQSTGDVLLFLNNDVFMTYDGVTEMMKYNNCTNMGCVGHRLVFDRDKNLIQHDGQTLYNENGSWKNLGHYNIMHNIKHIPSTNSYVEGVTAACLMVDKNIFTEVNGFDEGYVDILQDVDLNLKVGALGYDNYCIRTKALIHIDHSSRKGDETPDSKKDLVKYIKDWTSKGYYGFPKKNKKYSVLIVGTKPIEVKKVADSIKSTDPFDFIIYNNKGNFSYSGKALNILSDISSARYQFLTHQDIEFKDKEPFKKLEVAISKVGHDWGVLGIAGVTLRNGQITGYNYFEHRYPQPFFKVETVDEFAMIVDKTKGLKFNESLVGFHFYGADICLNAINKGYKNYCVDINIYHHSGGSENLTYNNNQGWREFKELGRQLYKIYGWQHPSFSTTTTLFSKISDKKTIINFFIGGVINEIPNNEVIEEVNTI